MSKHFLIACVLFLFCTAASAADFVKLRYTIRKHDGKVVEATAAGQAAVMAVDRMIPEWRDAVRTMVAGSAADVAAAAAVPANAASMAWVPCAKSSRGARSP